MDNLDSNPNILSIKLFIRIFSQQLQWWNGQEMYLSMADMIPVLQTHHSNIHQPPLPATPSYPPEHFFDCAKHAWIQWPLWIKPFFTAARWLNLQNANHTYLKLTKFCGGNFWHVLHKSWSFLSWSCMLRKKIIYNHLLILILGIPVFICYISSDAPTDRESTVGKQHSNF